MRKRKAKSQREPTIALINVVFLMLVFFLVAGTVARPLDPQLQLVRTADLDGAPPADALVVHADGTLSVHGKSVASAAEALAALGADALGADAGARLRLVPDRALPAERLVALGRALRAAGAGSVVIVTARGLE